MLEIWDINNKFKKYLTSAEVSIREDMFLYTSTYKSIDFHPACEYTNNKIVQIFSCICYVGVDLSHLPIDHIAE